MLARRAEVIEKVNRQYGSYTHFTILKRTFDITISWRRVLGISMRQLVVPVWAGIPVFVAAQWWAAKRLCWMEPVAWWGTFLFFGTWPVINNPVQWYVAPMYVGLYFPTAAAAIALVRQYIARNLVMTKRRDGSGESTA